MAYGGKNLFRQLGINALAYDGDEEEDPKAKLRKLLAGINQGAPVELAEPVSLPPQEIRPRPLQPLLDVPPARGAAPMTDPKFGVAPAEVSPSPPPTVGGVLASRGEYTDPKFGVMGDPQAFAGRLAEAANRQYQPITEAPMVRDEGSMRPAPDGAHFGGLPGGTAYEEDVPPGQAEYERRQRLKNPRTSGDYLEAFEATGRGELDQQLGVKKRSLLSRLFRGLGRGWKNWGPQDGLFGLFNMIGEGVESGASSKHDLEAQRQGKQSKMFRSLGLQRQQEEFQNKQATERMQAANYGSQIQSRNIQSQLDVSDNVRKQITARQEPFLKQWADLDEFDPSDPKYASFAMDAAKAGVDLIPKTKGQRYSAQIAPDGRVVITNTSTGEYKIGNENLAKPANISDKDLPDELFGLESDKEISDRAAASVGKLPEDRRLRPDVTSRLTQFAKPDGSFDEVKYWTAREQGDTSVSPSDIYENLPSDYEQRLAGTRTKLREGQKGLRAEVAKFRSALSTYRPKPDATPVSIPQIVQAFNEIMKLPPKDRPTAFQKFYARLPEMRIG